jgi:hypothetical protein
MTMRSLAGHAIEFADCHELGQGGPDTCTMSIDGEPVVRRFLWGEPPSLRFHPSPLEFNGDILVPMWGRPRFFLVRIDPRTMKIRRLTWRGESYMRLLKVVGDEVEFATWHDARKTRRVRLR